VIRQSKLSRAKNGGRSVDSGSLDVARLRNREIWLLILKMQTREEDIDFAG